MLAQCRDAYGGHMHPSVERALQQRLRVGHASFVRDSRKSFLDISRDETLSSMPATTQARPLSMPGGTSRVKLRTQALPGGRRQRLLTQFRSIIGCKSLIQFRPLPAARIFFDIHPFMHTTHPLSLVNSTRRRSRARFSRDLTVPTGQSRTRAMSASVKSAP